MEETKKSTLDAHSNIVCESKKHWSTYILPIILIFHAIPFLFMGLYGGVRLIVWLIAGVILLFVTMNSILRNLSTKWILTQEELIIKSGFLPWKKTYFEIPIETIYEAYYQYGFWAKIFGYGHLNIRRTEGSTSSFRTTAMTNCDVITQSINTEVKTLKKSKQVPQQSSVTQYSVADELMKLSELMTKGIITQEEFAEQKAKLLKGN